MTRFLIMLLVCTELLMAKNYKGAELRTIGTYTYGRIEARFMPAEGKGIVSSLFTYHEISSVSEWNEIDIEILGRYADDVQLTTITANQQIHSSHSFTRFNPHAAYHTYAFEWTPDYVAWFIDGSEVYRQEGAHISTLNRPQKIMMNLWVSDGATWVGDWNDAVLPRFAYYDWVSYARYTPGTGNTGTDHNFTSDWRDDFDTFDSGRWQKATHTFNGNLVDFDPRNIVYKDGKMILCLTDPDNTGFIDKSAPALLWARMESDSLTVRFSEKVATSSAELAANYTVGTYNILKARLMKDQQTVILKLSPQDSTNASSLVVFNMADRATPSNIAAYLVGNIIKLPALSLPFKIDTGTDNPGPGMLADQVWAPDHMYGHLDGYNQHINTYNGDVSYGNELNNVAKYKVRLVPGVYSISLSFEESFFQQPGKRLFDVVMEDSIITKALDLAQVAGLHQPYELSVDDFPVMDGVLDIHFTNWTDRPLINAITIHQTPTAIESGMNFQQPSEFHLYQNYPNPFNPITKIAYRLPTKAMVSLAIYNINGKRMDELVHGVQNAGRYNIIYKANDLASGFYIYRLQVSAGKKRFIQSHKMLILH